MQLLHCTRCSAVFAIAEDSVHPRECTLMRQSTQRNLGPVTVTAKVES